MAKTATKAATKSGTRDLFENEAAPRRLSAKAALSEFGSVPQILSGRSAGALERAERLFRSRTALPVPASAGAGRPAAIDPPQLRGA